MRSGIRDRRTNQLKTYSYSNNNDCKTMIETPPTRPKPNPQPVPTPEPQPVPTPIPQPVPTPEPQPIPQPK